MRGQAAPRFIHNELITLDKMIGIAVFAEKNSRIFRGRESVRGGFDDGIVSAQARPRDKGFDGVVENTR
jgi:hypothetical protein